MKEVRESLVEGYRLLLQAFPAHVVLVVASVEGFQSIRSKNMVQAQQEHGSD